MNVDLSLYSPASFHRGRSLLVEALWLFVRLVVFELNPFGCYAFKRLLRRWFGATIGRGVIIKPHVKITFAWKLWIGDKTWLGEECWLHNLAPIAIEDNVCLSQRSFLCTGSHDYKSQSSDLLTNPFQSKAAPGLPLVPGSGPALKSAVTQW
jgi:putative colanic acid biosynthesis acetyltransferase WcaF